MPLAAWDLPPCESVGWNPVISRRNLLKIAVASGAACLGAPFEPQGAECARSGILVWLDGGPSSLETFDAKPQSAGVLGAMRTAIPGVWVSESMPCMARALRRCTLVRSLSHGEAS